MIDCQVSDELSAYIVFGYPTCRNFLETCREKHP